MGFTSRTARVRVRAPSYVLPSLIALSSFSLAALLLYKVDDFAKQTRTVAGHNLQPTPWHLFPPKTFGDETRYSLASKIIHCSYLTCRFTSSPATPVRPSMSAPSCPQFFSWIHHDLLPWSSSRISLDHLMEAREFAAFRIVIQRGRLFVDFYFACVQSRAMFTIWGLLQLLRRYPGLVPDVDLMFDCMDKPSINRTEHAAFPLPLFRYCTTPQHFDIPFPDWSFWGWPETNLQPWDVEFSDIKHGSEALSWKNRFPWAYWKGNPDVASPIRTELLKCNHTKYWGAQVMRQDWEEEKTTGFEQSKLSKQCKHRYKIYAEGYAWSVSLKYIISCGSLALIISPEYEDFFSRGLSPKKNYWPISSSDLCHSIKHAVNWANANPDKAEAIGKSGQDFMADLNMEHVYDYMYNLLLEYSRLLEFKPVPPPSAVEVCGESLLCFADSKQMPFLERSAAQPSRNEPCTLMEADNELFAKWERYKEMQPKI